LPTSDSDDQRFEVLEFGDYLPDNLVLDLSAAVNVADNVQSSDILCKKIVSVADRVEKQLTGGFGDVC
jgi:hypothetical protein